MSSQRNRNARGPNRNGGQGEEFQLWQSIKEELRSFVDQQNADNDNVQKIIAQDGFMAQNTDTMNIEAEERKQEDLFRKGVRSSEAVSESIKGLLGNLELLRAIQKGKEEEAEQKSGMATPSRASLLGSGSARSTGRAGTREREKERERERAAEREREQREKEKEKEQREKERERERERERDREKEREQREREKEREKEERREKEKEKEQREREREKEREKDPYEFDGPGDEMETDLPPAAGNGGGGHSRKDGSGSANSASGDRPRGSRDSVPPRAGDRDRDRDRDTPVKADSVEPQGPGIAGSGSSVASAIQRSKVMFVKGQDVVFKPKPVNANETTEWFLGKVQQVLGEGKSRRYKVKDEDPDLAPEQRQEYRTSASNMIPLPPPGQELLELEPGRTVLALYPDSTTFYKAEVMSTDRETGKVNLRFEGEENSGTLQEVERRFVVEYRN